MDRQDRTCESALEAREACVEGKHRPLLPPTSLTVRPGEVRAVVGDPGDGHTALVLALAGRLRLTSGEVLLDGSTNDRRRQGRVALVDVPGVTEHDDHVPLATVIGEELALAGGRPAPEDVLRWTGDRSPGLRFDHLRPDERVSLLLRLAALRRGTSHLLLVLPERWGCLPTGWEPVARELADRGHGVLVTVGPGTVHLLTVPHTFIGPHAFHEVSR